jgi:hypothetical protein
MTSTSWRDHPDSTSVDLNSCNRSNILQDDAADSARQGKYSMRKYLAGAAALAVFASPIHAQDAAATVAPEANAPALQAAAVTEGVVLAANTELVLTINSPLSSQDARLGDKFSLSLAKDLMIGKDLLIPRGTRAVGQVTYRTGKGGFGKSGKMELDFRYLDFNNQRIPIEGHYRQEGEGNSAATVGAVLAAGVIGGLIVHGRSARIPEGREFTVRTVDAIPVTTPTAAGRPALIAANYTPTAVNLQVMTDKERKAFEKATKASQRDASRSKG